MRTARLAISAAIALSFSCAGLCEYLGHGETNADGNGTATCSVGQDSGTTLLHLQWNSEKGAVLVVTSSKAWYAQRQGGAPGDAWVDARVIPRGTRLESGQDARQTINIHSGALFGTSKITVEFVLEGEERSFPYACFVDMTTGKADGDQASRIDQAATSADQKGSDVCRSVAARLRAVAGMIDAQSYSVGSSSFPEREEENRRNRRLVAEGIYSEGQHQGCY